MDIFEYASRKKTRFNVSKGTVSSEDLWDFSLESLNDIAKAINKQLKALDEEDFISKKNVSDTDLSVKFEIVKHIISVKLAEADKKKLIKEKAEKRAQLKELISKKEISSLESKSIEELERELLELDKV